jgi:hypothetical protein
MKFLHEAFGCEIYQDGNKYFVKYDNGRSASKNEIIEITEAEASQFSLSEESAYKILLAAQKRATNDKNNNCC